MKKNQPPVSGKRLLKTLYPFHSLHRDLYTSRKVESKGKARLTFIGEKKMEKVQNQLYFYTPESCSLKENITDFEVITSTETHSNLWLNFHGVHEVETVEKIGSILNLDRLMIRQILDTTLRSKIEAEENFLFFNMKSILKKEEGTLRSEQVSFILGTNYVVSFQEEKGDHFGSIRYRITENAGLIRKKTSDYLLSQLLDAILDNYFETIEMINREISELEKSIFKNPEEKTVLILEDHKSTAKVIKKSLRPIKEALLNILNTNSKLIRKENIRYFKDLVNSSIAALEEIDSTLDTLEGLTNIYFASLSHKMNEVMKMLTLVATIFIPLTFIAGVYGMNFDYMPELHYKYGYFAILGVMLAVSIWMIVYFKRKRWI